MITSIWANTKVKNIESWVRRNTHAQIEQRGAERNSSHRLYQIYSHQQLLLKSIARLKQIYSEIACTVEVSDKRCKDAWISAIAEYQANKIQKLTLAAPNEQALAQAELDDYIADQAQAVAPEPLTIVEISFDHHEYYAGNQLIASISHDGNHLTQRWVAKPIRN